MGFHRLPGRHGRPLLAQPGHFLRRGHAPHQLHDAGAGARFRHPGGNGRFRRWRIDRVRGGLRRDGGGSAAVQRSAPGRRGCRCFDRLSNRLLRPGHVPAIEAGAGEAPGPLERLPGGPSRPVGPHHRRRSEGRFHGPCLPAFLRGAGRRLGGAGCGLFRSDYRDAGNGDVPSGGGKGAGGQLFEDG